jgi:hypothetical protein
LRSTLRPVLAAGYRAGVSAALHLRQPSVINTPSVLV